VENTLKVENRKKSEATENVSRRSVIILCKIPTYAVTQTLENGAVLCSMYVVVATLQTDIFFFVTPVLTRILCSAWGAWLLSRCTHAKRHGAAAHHN